MLCRICARNGVSRDGGRIGLCWQHVKRRCDTCGESSAGEQTCTGCLHQLDVLRWKAHADPLHTYPDQQQDLDAMRVEKLMQGKFHFHAAVEVFFRGLLVALEALYGTPAKREPPEGGDAAGLKEAA